MQIVIHDHKHQDQNSWDNILLSLAKENHVPCVLRDRFCPDLNSVIASEHNLAGTVVFLHADESGEWDKAQGRKKRPLNCILVHVGTNGFAGVTEPYQNRRFSIRFSAVQFRDSGNGSRLFESFASEKPDWGLLNPTLTEDMLAMRMFCEAWHMNQGQPAVDHGGIEIHAPTKPAEWRAPFCSIRQREADDQSIVKRLGASGSKAAALLKAVGGRKDVLKRAVSSLLDELR